MKFKMIVVKMTELRKSGALCFFSNCPVTPQVSLRTWAMIATRGYRVGVSDLI